MPKVSSSFITPIAISTTLVIITKITKMNAITLAHWPLAYPNTLSPTKEYPFANLYEPNHNYPVKKFSANKIKLSTPIRQVIIGLISFFTSIMSVLLQKHKIVIFSLTDLYLYNYYLIIYEN